MAIRKYIQISIAFAEATSLPILPIQNQAHYLQIRILELPNNKSMLWRLSASESIMRKASQWTANLSVEESEQLSTLLLQLPEENMLSSEVVFDGSETEMFLIRKDKTISFRWEVPPWINQTLLNKQGNSRKAWMDIGTLANFVMETTEKHKISGKLDL